MSMRMVAQTRRAHTWPSGAWLVLALVLGCSGGGGTDHTDRALSCSQNCTAGAQPGTGPSVGPVVRRLTPVCPDLTVAVGHWFRFWVDARFLPVRDGTGGVLPPASATHITWYVNNTWTKVENVAGPWFYGKTFNAVGTFVIRAHVADATLARATDIEWTVRVVNNLAAAGVEGGPAPAPYYCYGAPTGSSMDIVRGESRRVWSTAYDLASEIDGTTWYLGGAQLSQQTVAQVPYSLKGMAIFYQDLHETSVGTKTLESQAYANSSVAIQRWTVQIGERGRGLEVENADALLMGADANAQITALMAFIDRHRINALTLHGVEDVLAGGRCLANPSNTGCMALTTLALAMHARSGEVAVDITSATGLADVEAFHQAGPIYFDALSTQCPFWDGSTACFGGAFDGGTPGVIDTYMDLVQGMVDTGLRVTAVVASNEVEKLRSVAAVVDRVLVYTAGQPSVDCHYKQVDALLEALAGTPERPVEVWPIFDEVTQHSPACAGVGVYSAFEDWEEDFYARLRGEGDPICAWDGSSEANRPAWFDGIRVTGFQYGDYARLAEKLEDADCDGVDDDCDGRRDEGYVSVTTSCGVGGCQANGALRCSAGEVVDTCEPLPGTPDTTCNGLDDDCDGLTDDAFVPGPTCDYTFTPALCGYTTCTNGVLGDNIVRPSCDVEACPTPSSTCLAAACVDYACTNLPVPDGTPCTENMGTLCVAGACVPPGCGNGYREPTESCDDGNLLSGDACTPTCGPDFLFIDGSLTGDYDPVPTAQAPVFGVDGAGNLLAVWIRDDYGSEALHARRYTRGGVNLEPPDPVTMEQGTIALDEALFRPSNADPVVVGLADGGWVVAWSTLRAGSRDIVYRLVHPDGSLDQERIANVDREGTQWRPAIAATSEGFVIAWVDTYETLADPYDGVRARRFGSTGLPLATPFYLATNRADWESRVALAGDPTTTDWAAAWTQGFDTRIQVRRFAGATAIDTTERDASGHLSDRPTIASLANGEFVVAWESYAVDGDGDIESRVLDATSGNPLVQAITAHDGVLGERELRPAVARWNPGSYLVTWWTPDSAAGHSGTYLSPNVTGFAWAEAIVTGPRVSEAEDGARALTWVADGMWLTWREYIDPYFTPVLTALFFPRSAP